MVFFGYSCKLIRWSKKKQMENKLILKIVDAGLKGDTRATQMSVRKLASAVRNSNTELFKELSSRLAEPQVRRLSSANISKPPPVDSDSRLSLIRFESDIRTDHPPIHSSKVDELLKQVLLEREMQDKLLSAGLLPSRSLLFQGPPGVGKTMSARWLAEQLDLPFLVLDLASVMSSFLGKTGSNIKSVLDYASSFPCVLLLDEFDAIAKRRDDTGELGELKRLVTVLLQAIDSWPENSLLIAATNHGELLDPAIWRRFDVEVDFPLPDTAMINKYINTYWSELSVVSPSLLEKLEGVSYSDINRSFNRSKKKSILSSSPFDVCLMEELQLPAESLSSNNRQTVIYKLHLEGKSQRAIASELNISRPIVKKAIDYAKNRDGGC